MSARDLREAIEAAAPPPADVEREAELARLAALPAVVYDSERVAAARRLGCRVGTLDAEIRARRPAHAGRDPGLPTGAGRPLELAEPEPWPDAVDGAALLDEIAAAFRRFVALQDHAAPALALWVVHAHAAHAAAFITPRLAITSPQKRCGKTTCLDLIAALVPRPLTAASLTPPAVFRSIETARPTLLIDEADTFLAASDELRGVLNSGHRRGGQVVRTVEISGQHEPRAFATFGPAAIAMIGRLPDTLADRSIAISLRRRLPTETVERTRADRLDQMHPIARRCARWAADHVAALCVADPETPAGLNDRAADNWRLLLAIADAAGGRWPDLARRAALALSGTADEEDIGLALLRDVVAHIDAARAADPRADRVYSQPLAEALAALETRPWAEFARGRPISPHRVARMLKPFGIYPAQDKRGSFYRFTAFDDVRARYLPPLKLPPCHKASTGGGFERNGNTTGWSDAWQYESAENPGLMRDGGTVAVREPLSGAARAHADEGPGFDPFEDDL